MTSRRMVPFGILSRSVAIQLVRPFLMGFFVVTFLLTLNLLLQYLDLFLGKGIPFWTVARLFLLGLGWMVVLSVPCGVLVAVLMAYGQMSQDNEITALRASGVNLFSIILPSLIVSGALTIGLIFFNNRILPETNHAFANLAAEIHRIRPTAQIEEGVFIDDFEGYNLLIRHLEERTGKMRDILIIDASRNRTFPRTIMAREGTLEASGPGGPILLRLRDGEIHEVDPDARDARYRRLTFSEQTMVLEGSGDPRAQPVRRSRGQREMSISMMREEIGKLERDRRGFQAHADSLLALLGPGAEQEISALDPADREARGWRGVLGLLGSLVGRSPPDPPPPPEIAPERRRTIEEIQIDRVQARGVRKRIDQLRVEIQKKFSIPFACPVFVFLGAPLGIRARRGGMAAGFLSIAFFLFYWLCLVGGEQLADRGMVAPWLAMWLPNAVLGAGGVILTIRVATMGFPVRATHRRSG